MALGRLMLGFMVTRKPFLIPNGLQSRGSPEWSGWGVGEAQGTVGARRRCSGLRAGLSMGLSEVWDEEECLGPRGKEVLWAEGTACTKEARSQGPSEEERRVGGEVWSVRASCAWYMGP